MHVPAVPLFCDATRMAVALTAWACHRCCLQLYLGPKPVRRRALLISKGLLLGPKPVRRRALLFSKGLLLFFFFIFFFNLPGTFGGLNVLKNS